MRQAYAFVRQELGTTAERMKRQYDLRVRPQKFQQGEWVLYYNPRRYQGRQQKCERKYSPYLVIKALPPVNYLIQKSKRSRPIISHVDKLKKWSTDNPPASWLSPEGSDSKSAILEESSKMHDTAVTANREQFDTSPTDVIHRQTQEAMIAGDPSSVISVRQRPPRAIHLPRRYQDLA